MRNDVEHTNNRSERALRFAVLWRKRSNGTQSGKRQPLGRTNPIFKANLPYESFASISYPCNAIDAYFKDQTPDLQWVAANY